MSKSSTHMTINERHDILKYIKENYSMRLIAKIIGVSASTISRELYKHRGLKKPNNFNNSAIKDPCLDSRLTHAPWVCNGCKNYIHCRKAKYVYDPFVAHKTYLSTLKNTRRKVGCGPDAFKYLNNILTPLIKEKSQTLGHIYATNKDRLVIGRTTLYRYIDQGMLEVKNCDLPRRVRYQAHRTKKTSFMKDTTIRLNRTYLDALAYLANHPYVSVFEMDTVEGIKGGKVLLTLLLRKSNFMFAFLRDKNDAQSVVDIFDELQRKIGFARFTTLFNVCLTDNGSEFAYVDKLEAKTDKCQRCHVFYCDARASQQKGKVEKNHEYIRKFLPQGISFDKLTQIDVDLMMNHINSTKRESLANKAPFEVLSRSQLISIKKLGFVEIAPHNVTLNPSLFYKRK